MEDEGGAGPLMDWAGLSHGLLVATGPQCPIPHLLWKQLGVHREVLAVACAVQPILPGQGQQGQQFGQHWVDGPWVWGPTPHSSSEQTDNQAHHNDGGGVVSAVPQIGQGIEPLQPCGPGENRGQSAAG